MRVVEDVIVAIPARAAELVKAYCREKGITYRGNGVAKRTGRGGIHCGQKGDSPHRVARFRARSNQPAAVRACDGNSAPLGLDIDERKLSLLRSPPIPQPDFRLSCFIRV